MEELAFSKVAKSENMECIEGQNVSLRYYRLMHHCVTRNSWPNNAPFSGTWGFLNT